MEKHLSHSYKLWIFVLFVFLTVVLFLGFGFILSSQIVFFLIFVIFPSFLIILGVMKAFNFKQQ